MHILQCRPLAHSALGSSQREGEGTGEGTEKAVGSVISTDLLSGFEQLNPQHVGRQT
jgi:hypothetical protein